MRCAARRTSSACRFIKKGELEGPPLKKTPPHFYLRLYSHIIKKGEFEGAPLKKPLPHFYRWLYSHI